MKATLPLTALCIGIVTASTHTFATPSSSNAEPSTGVWSMGMTTRSFSSPYQDEGLRNDFIPEINYQGEQWYIDGTQAGWRSEKHDGFYLNAFSRYRFGSYSEKNSDALAGMRRLGTLEAGAKLVFESELGELSVAASHDTLNRHQGWSSTVEWRGDWHADSWKLEPFVAVDYDSAEVNNYFFGVENDEANPDRPAYRADSAINYRLGVDSWYRLGGPHLFGAGLSHTFYDTSVEQSPITDASGRSELRLSYRYEFINNRAAQAVAKAGESPWLKGDWEWRLAGGYIKDGNFIEMIYLNNMAVDTEKTALVSAFLSKKITERTFDLPIQMHITGGLVRHFEKNLQSDFNEYVFALKGYFSEFPWSHIIETRVGFGYGFSYGDKVSFEESASVMEDNINDSRLLQYLDYSWDVNIGDLFRAPSAKHCYLGYSIHHRSGIFSKAEIYNNVDGGSNWNTFYVQCKVNN
ncbi:MipA/OmpV family protein [Simiduia litorea]|uniref:MipA/OmpV family protein n=1 Tax=Simiduia litorea TaxID=1435348 RepID=UPI0036F39BC5